MGVGVQAETATTAASPNGALWPRLAASNLAWWIGVATALFGLGLAGLGLEQWSDKLVMGWPMNAVGLACLLQSPRKHWPGLLAILVLANLPPPLAHGKPLAVATVLAVVNAIQILGCAAALRWLIGPRIDLGRYRDLLIFSLGVGLFMPLVSITLLTIAQPQHRPLLQTLPRLGQWAVGAALSYLVVTPTLIAWTLARTRALVRQIGPQRLGLALLGYTAIVFVLATQKYGELRLLLVPALLWLTFQLGSAGATIGLLIQAAVLTGCVLARLGPPISGATLADQLAQLQLGLALNAVCAYPVAAALAQRWRLGQSLAVSNASLEQARKLTQLAEQVGGIGYLHYDVATGEQVYSEHFAEMVRAEDGGPPRAIHPDDLENAKRHMKRAIATGEDYEAPMRVGSEAGGWRRLRSRTTCQMGPDGKVAALVSIVIDVTGLELADQAVRASEARYRLLAENANDIIMQTDQDDQLVYVSPAALPLIGQRPEDMTSARGEDLVASLIHPDDIPRTQARFADLHRGEVLDAFTYRLRHKDGHWVWLETRAAVLRDPETGAVTGGIHVGRDITERKAMEAELERKCADAEAANRAKSEFLANMSHEIRTPLNGVMGVAGALARTPLAPDQLEMVSLIETSAKTLETLLSDILDLARIEAGKMELKPEPFDLTASVNACAALFEAAARDKHLDLEVVIEPGAVGAYVGDAARIRQILCNLLGNAVKFTAVGGVSLVVSAREVEAGQSEAGSGLCFQVRDTGIGFDAETKARLFSRFEQADGSITRKFGGSGLGLSISRSLAEAMGGRLEADAAPGAGAVFTFTLALPRCADAPAEADAGPDRLVEDDPVVGMRVLVAEDHPTNRRVVQLILGAAGVELTCVENGAEAVAAFRGGGFDLVLMDMQMPVMDGLTAIREIRKLEAAEGLEPTPIHVLTANAMAEHITASFAAGADGHLSKPILADALLACVGEASGARRRVRRLALAEAG